MIQIEICPNEWATNRRLRELQEKGHIIEDIKFAIGSNGYEHIMIIYQDIEYDNQKNLKEISKALKEFKHIPFDPNSTDDSHIDYTQITIRS